jgi:hypothetical protein
VPAARGGTRGGGGPGEADEGHGIDRVGNRRRSEEDEETRVDQRVAKTDDARASVPTAPPCAALCTHGAAAQSSSRLVAVPVHPHADGVTRLSLSLSLSLSTLNSLSLPFVSQAAAATCCGLRARVYDVAAAALGALVGATIQ